MDQQSPVLVVLSDDSDRPFATQVANALGYSFANVIVGTGYDAARFIDANSISPTYIIMHIGPRKDEVLGELDELSQHCVAGTQVVVIGEANDIHFYRALTDRGVVDYFPVPPRVDDICRALMKQGAKKTNTNSKVVSFMSAAAGDGSSTLALNTAYCFAKEFNQKTIIVDMDYQFGMVSKNLDLSSPFGIKELFEHPDRGIDSTLVERMVVGYNNNMDVIAAPNELKFLPELQPEVIRDLVQALQEKYKYIVLDLPHFWSPWISAAFSNSDYIVLVAQLWLKSVTHSSRLLNVWRDMGVNQDSIRIAINRSGAKYKEGVTAKDYERVCNTEISYFIPNDIKTVVNAENQGKTILELGKTKLSTEILTIAESLRDMSEKGADEGSFQPAAPSRPVFFAPLTKRLT